ELRNEQIIPDEQRRLHGARRDRERLEQERAENERDQQGFDDGPRRLVGSALGRLLWRAGATSHLNSLPELETLRAGGRNARPGGGGGVLGPSRQGKPGRRGTRARGLVQAHRGRALVPATATLPCHGR